MTYVKVTDGAASTYPYDVRQLRRDNPNTSFPKKVSDEMLEDWGVFPVAEEDMPDHDERTQNCVKTNQPALNGGNWTMSWTISDKTAEETLQYDDDLAAKMRADRNTRLAETDWWAVADLTMTSEQTEYRNLLRQVPQQIGFPLSVTWPVRP